MEALSAGVLGIFAVLLTIRIGGWMFAFKAGVQLIFVPPDQTYRLFFYFITASSIGISLFLFSNFNFLLMLVAFLTAAFKFGSYRVKERWLTQVANRIIETENVDVTTARERAKRTIYYSTNWSRK